MNDPGLDDTIEESSRKVQRELKDEEEQEEVATQDEQTFLNPRFVLRRSILREVVSSILTLMDQSMVVRLDGLSPARGKASSALDHLRDKIPYSTSA